MQIRTQLAETYYQLGDFEKALHYIDNTLEYARKHQVIELERHALTVYGLLYLTNNNVAEGLKYTKQAWDITEKHPISPLHRSKNTLLLGLSYLANGQLDSADLFIQKGVDLAAAVPDSIRLSYAYILKSVLFISQNQPEQWDKYLTIAEDNAKACNALSAVALIKKMRMQYFLSTGNYNQAYFYGKNSEDIIRSLDLPYLKMELDSLLYEAALGVNDTLSALKFYKNYSENRLKVYNLNQAAALLEIKYKNELQQKNLQLHNKELSLQSSKKTKIILLSFNLLLITLITGYFSIRSIRNNYIRHLFRKEKKIDAIINGQTSRLVISNMMLTNPEPALHPVSDAFTSEQPNENQENRRYLFLDLLRIIEEEKLYLKPDLSQKTIISLLSTNKRYLYEAIAQNTDLNFKQIINSYRVMAAKKIIESMTSSTSEELPSNLYLQAGFNSSTSYYRAFRHFPGLTPKEYHKEYLQDLKSSKVVQNGNCL